MSSENAVVKWLSGKKTYLDAGAIIVCGVLQGYGVQIPPYVWAAIAAFGLASLRDAVKKAEV